MTIAGAILGTAVGDALGLPYEAISRRRGVRLLGEPDRHRFLFGHGMVSDDTEHTCLVAQALAVSGGDPDRFARALAWRLRWWLLGLPAGIGFATLRAVLKLWLGFGPSRSGVHSAGNGPAMRSAVIGAAVADASRMRALVEICTRITHTDPKAFHGALAVALAARNPRASPDEYVADLTASLGEGALELLQSIEHAAASVTARQSTREFAEVLGLGNGISGYTYHTVPVCIHAWLSHPTDYRSAVRDIILCGGDTDTTAAIVGGIVGSGVGVEGIPREHVQGLFEWPRTAAWMKALARTVEQAMARNAPQEPPVVFGPFVLARNLFFIAIVLVHVARRCLPPY